MTDGNHLTYRGASNNESDYYFYVFTQEKDSGSPLVYLAYKFNARDKSIKKVANLTKIKYLLSLEPTQAFEIALNRFAISPEWMEHLDRLELPDGKQIGQVLPLPGYDRVDFPFVIGTTMCQQRAYLINTRTLLPQLLIKLCAEGKANALR
jgi:hypothetical protein